MSSADPTVYTSDPARVIEVVWLINYDDIMPEIDPFGDDVPVPDVVLTSRFSTAAMLLESKIRRQYPNCTRVSIRNGGWGGEMAQISPRANTDDFSVYEPFFDEVTQWTEEACSIAIEQHPMPSA